jgi:DNA gyrase subunit A
MDDLTNRYDKVEFINISGEIKASFLDYAMSVIVQRALPDARDGMKPVQRRILYGMNELGNYANSPFKKSARIVGEVMGKYHPHGDSSIYEAMVRMAQPFSYRYPLVEGHGNFGNIDGDGAAAQRYTEARMSKISMEMLKDIQKNTVDFIDNYDGEEQEPVVLPAHFPNLLINGTTGIAVGMATNIPPHNIVETIDAIDAVIDDPEISVYDLMTKHIQGPDFPTGGIILGRSGIKKAYETGKGTIYVRAKAEINELSNGRHEIVISEIPYGVNKKAMYTSILNLARNKEIDGITNMADESNMDGIKIIIEYFLPFS